MLTAALCHCSSAASCGTMPALTFLWTQPRQSPQQMGFWPPRAGQTVEEIFLSDGLGVVSIAHRISSTDPSFSKEKLFGYSESNTLNDAKALVGTVSSVMWLQE